MPIARAKTAALLALPWVRARLQQHQAQIQPLDADFDLLPHTAQGYCVFLGDDRRCMIQALAGAALKPDECHRYPFAALRLPDGTLGLDYSLSCKSLSQALAQQQAGVLPAPGVSPEPLETAFPARVRVTGIRRVGWQTFQAYREAIAAVCYTPGVSADAALGAITRLMRSLRDTRPVASPVFPEKSLRVSGVWHTLWVWGYVRRPYGMLSLWAVMRDGAYADPKVLGRQPLSLRGLRHTGWDTATLDPLLTAFLAAFLRRYVLVAYGHSLAAMLLMAVCAMALVRWYARLLALAQDKHCPEPDDVRLAIRVVERYYTGHQPAFPERFRWLPGKVWLLAAMGYR